MNELSANHAYPKTLDSATTVRRPYIAAVCLSAYGLLRIEAVTAASVSLDTDVTDLNDSSRTTVESKSNRNNIIVTAA